jgi:hypothetical protein
MQFSCHTKLIFAITTLLILPACGGGGGGSTPVAATSFSATCSNGSTQTSATSQAAAAALCPAASTIVSTVAATTYAALSEEQAVYNRLNTERVACGFGSLSQNANLDTAAKNHSDWMLLNNTLSHAEVAGTTGFTGLNSVARDTAAGFTSLDGNEDIFALSGGTGLLAGFGDVSARSLLSAPYHLFASLSACMGISVQSISSVGLPVGLGVNLATTIDFAVPQGGTYQLQDATSVLTYPCQGTAGANYRLTNESPSPVPGRNLVTNPLGSVVFVMLRQGQVLTITSASMTNLATGIPVALRPPVTGANDPANYLGLFGNYMGYIIPDAPVAQNTAYQVTLAGTNNGVAFSRTFTFTTGTGG